LQIGAYQNVFRSFCVACVLLVLWACAPGVAAASVKPDRSDTPANPNQPPAITDSSAPLDTDYILPPESSKIVQALTAQPFVRACGHALESVRILPRSIVLHFGKPPQVTVSLTHLGRAPDGKSATEATRFFRVGSESRDCPQVAGQVAELIRTRETTSPFVALAQPASPAPPPLAETLESEQEWDSEFSGHEIEWAIFPLLMVLTLCLILFQTLTWAWRVLNRAGNDPRTAIEKRHVALVLALSGLVLLVGVLMDPFPINWYPVVYPGERYKWVSLAMLHLQYWVYFFLSPLVTPSQVVMTLVNLSGALCVPLTYRLARRFQSPMQALIASLFMGGLPLLLFVYASDCQHVVALAVWLWGFWHWMRTRGGRMGSLAAVLVAQALLPMIRLETLGWVLAWYFLLPRTKCTLIAYLVAAVEWMTMLGVIAFYAPAMRYSIDGWDFVNLLFSPFHYLSAVTDFVGFGLVLGGLWTYGLIVLFKENRRLALGLFVATCLIVLPVVMSGRGVFAEYVSMRYALAGLFFVFLMLAAGLDALARRLPRSARIGAFLVLAILLVIEATDVFSPARRNVFDQEYRFLSKQLKTLPQGVTVCAISPLLNHNWLGEQVDFDLSLMVPRYFERYIGVPVHMKRLKETLAEARSCDYFYEGSMCSVTLSDHTYRTASEKSANLERYRDWCNRYLQTMGGSIVAHETVKQHLYRWDLDNDLAADLTLRLYKTQKAPRQASDPAH
jgi:hypothetical protein